jgi:spoIIIJ-associated protein
VAHAEASARTVDAAVTAAAAQLGLRADQVDIEVLEDPIPSTFGYIGTPARVRVTPRPNVSQAGSKPQITSDASDTPKLTEASNDSDPIAGAAAQASTRSAATADTPGRPEPARDPDMESGRPGLLHQPGQAGEDGHVPGAVAAASESRGEPASIDGPEGAGVGVPPASAPVPAASVPAPTGGAGTSGSTAATAVVPPPGQGSVRTRSPRRTPRDEPIEPQMVEEDTERAGDFLEGLLDALDVDGDITTWVDEVGGHIDLEGSDLDVLVGSNGETLDALQELTRLAVLRRSKRRVRLLIDINGFRARQRERLSSIVRDAAEQVIRTREDHEFQPMTPAERKVVHDAVAAIDGVRTESLGEEPNRRVVIRPE